MSRFTSCPSPTILQKEGSGGRVDPEGKSSGQKQHVFQFALLKHPLSKSSGCLQGLDIMTHLSGFLRIYQKSLSEWDLGNEAYLYHREASNTFSVLDTIYYRDHLVFADGCLIRGVGWGDRVFNHLNVIEVSCQYCWGFFLPPQVWSFLWWPMRTT